MMYAPFLPRNSATPGQQCEVMGSDMSIAGGCLPQAFSIY